jgi:hypothetical protein
MVQHHISSIILNEFESEQTKRFLHKLTVNPIAHILFTDSTDSTDPSASLTLSVRHPVDPFHPAAATETLMSGRALKSPEWTNVAMIDQSSIRKANWSDPVTRADLFAVGNSGICFSVYFRWACNDRAQKYAFTEGYRKVSPGIFNRKFVRIKEGVKNRVRCRHFVFFLISGQLIWTFFHETIERIRPLLQQSQRRGRFGRAAVLRQIVRCPVDALQAPPVNPERPLYVIAMTFKEVPSRLRKANCGKDLVRVQRR